MTSLRTCSKNFEEIDNFVQSLTAERRVFKVIDFFVLSSTAPAVFDSKHFEVIDILVQSWIASAVFDSKSKQYQ